MTWTCYLTITNDTDRDLTLTQSTLDHGLWFRSGVDDNAPVSVKARGVVQAMGIRAYSGTWTGYECHLEWTSATPDGEADYGTVGVWIDVPYNGDNQARVTKSGALHVTKWDGTIPAKGTDFNLNMTVSVMAPAQALNGPGQAAVAELDAEYQRYLLELASNPDITDWSAVQSALPEVEDFIFNRYTPKEQTAAPHLVARSAPFTIDTKLWSGIGDPYYEDEYSKSLFVEEYFAVAIHSVATDSRDWVSLPAGTQVTLSKRTTVQSAIHTTLTTTWSVNTSLTEQANEPVTGSSVASSLETHFGIENVLEESREYVQEVVVELVVKAPDDQDETIIPWVYSTAVALYRREKAKGDKPGRIMLIAVSEWARTQQFATYRSGVHVDPQK